MLLVGTWHVLSTVHADGEQLLPGGAGSVARGGANAARPTDATTLLQNPAGMVELSSNQGYYGIDTGYNQICVHPYGYYGWGVYLPDDRAGTASNADAHRSEFGDPASSAYGTRHLDSVCNSAPFGGIPQLVFALHPTDDLSIGFGFVAPVLVVGGQFGGADGTIAVNGGSESRPTPTRYELVRQKAKFALDPTLGVAYRVLPWLSLGLTLQVTMASLNNDLVMALRAGTSPADDMFAHFHVSDYFMPALTFGVLAKPTKALSIAGTFMWSDGFDGSGNMTVTTNAYHRNAVGDEALPLQNDPVPLKRVRVAVPWTATLAARYAQPRAGASADADYMGRDLWDVEVDASYTAGHAVGANRVEIASDFALQFRRADASPQLPLMVNQGSLEPLNVDRHLLDVMAVRLGGSVNVLPGKVQLSAGGFFQTRGVEADYVSVSSYGLMRVGFGLGAVVRVGSGVDLMVSYAHIFQGDFNVAPPPHQPRDQATDDPQSGFDQRIYEDGQLSQQPHTDPHAPAPSAANGVASLQQPALFESDTLRRRVINQGSYTASFNVLSLGILHRF
jgi:hypothetical protein